MSNSEHNGFLAVPQKSNGNGVLVLHAWWGLNDTIRAICERLAENGYFAFAPDLYHSKIADNIAAAEMLSDELDNDQARINVAEAAAFLSERASADERGLAVMGFSLGASFALDLSVTEPEQIRSVVVFYGTRPGDYSRSKAEYLGHFAEQDEYEPQSEVDNLQRALRQAGRSVQFYQYPGIGHWFFEPDQPDAFNQESADLAWERTLSFLRDSFQRVQG